MKPEVVCPGEQTDPLTARRNPSAYAWKLFGEINAPAFPGNAQDTRRVWETWKSASDVADSDDAIYLDNGHAPNEWNVEPRGTIVARGLRPIQQLRMLWEQIDVFRDVPGADAVTAPFAPSEISLGQEVRSNRPAFNFILSNQLFNRQGQYEYARANPMFDFPTASKEVKAVWMRATSSMQLSDYYWTNAYGKTYVLVAMHVISKDLPLWHWSSFVHKDHDEDSASGYVAPLAYDQDIPELLRGTPFENYRLLGELVESRNGTLTSNGNGAQIDSTTSEGAPTVIGNPNIEVGFEKQSSCIACHARASIAQLGEASIEFNTIALEIGRINLATFNENGDAFYPLDFVWSLSNAKDYVP